MGLLCPFRAQLGPRLTQCGLGQGLYFRTKWRLHPSSRLVTINMGQILGGGGCTLCSGGSWVPIEHKVAWTEAYLHTKWHIDASSRLATITRRPTSGDRRARRQFQATGQPVSRTQASDATTSRLPRYEAKCVQRRCLQCGSVPLRSDIKGTELPLPIY